VLSPLKILLLTATLAMSIGSYGQVYYFRHYEVESGLSNNAVLCSVQDKLGFMWFGTRDGLNRFDGYTFKVYRFPGNNLVRALHIDASGSLLACTERNIYRYNTRSDSFSLVLSTQYFPIDEITCDSRGNIWFNAGGVLSRYSEHSKQIKVYQPKDFFWATSVSSDSQGVIWAASSDGYLEKYDEAGDSFTSFDLFPHSPRSDWSINNIECSPDRKIFIGTNKAGFKIFDMKTGLCKDVQLGSEKLDNLFIRCFLRVSPTRLWIGTETGIFIYNIQSGVSTRLQKNNSDQYALSDNVIYTLCEDKEGGIWAGSYFGGINYYPKQFTPFQKYYQQSSENPLSGNIIREITRDHFGNLWIGAEDGGVNKLDARTGKLVYYKPDNTGKSISYISVHSLLPVGDELWIGTYEHGLDILDIKTGKVVRHYSDDARYGFKFKVPFCFLKTNEGEIIIGATSGIYAYRRDKDDFKPVPGFNPSDLYNFILKDSRGTLWAAIPGKGVCYVNAETKKSGSYTFDPSDSTSISSDKVNSIFEDSRKDVWFATEDGLCKWSPLSYHFIRYSVRNGFPSNFMLSILEDDHGQLWISTTKGLVCFNPQTNKLLVYTTANGLLSDQFNFSSAFKDNDQRMYFGSAKGLISFRPAEFIQDSFVPPVYITGLQIDNQEIGINKNGSPLKQSVILTKKMTLSHNQSTFSLDFAAPGYTAPENLRYAYRLEGLTNKWTFVKGIRKVNFTKVVPGSYVFIVKASSSGGIWSNKETRLIIEILPPWWASPAAYTGYALITVFLIYSLFYYYHKRVEEKNRRKIELMEIAKEKELMQIEIAKEKEILESKIEFFTQVAHEIRTPLTLIKIPLGKVIRKTAGIPEIGNSLKIIGGNTNRLIELSNQLLDFRQTELKAYRLNLVAANIAELLNEAHDNFTTLAEQNNITLTTNAPPVPLLADIDVDAFTKIIYNLYGNAVKYAAADVSISLLPHFKNGNTFTILFKNDGYLIPDHLRERIFEPFFRIKDTEAKTGSGIGLALAYSLTQLHDGTLMLEHHEAGYNVFALTLPIHHHEADHFIS